MELVQIYLKNLIKLELLAISLNFFSFKLTNLPSWIRIHSPGFYNGTVILFPALNEQCHQKSMMAAQHWSANWFNIFVILFKKIVQVVVFTRVGQ